MVTTSFKTQCVELTHKKHDWFTPRLVEYARVYNLAAKFMSGLPAKYIDATNPSKLYNIWVKEQPDGNQLIQSDLLSGLQLFNAIKDAKANFLAMKSNRNGWHHSVMEPNIIKFENSEYDIIKIKPQSVRKKQETRYAIAVGDKNKKTGIREIVIPLITGRPEWGLVEHLETGIRMQAAKKLRNKELAHKNKVKGAKREKSVKAGLGVITYNRRDNTISIPKTVESAGQKKGKRGIDTIIGVDLGKNNVAVFTAIRVFPDTQAQVQALIDSGVKDLFLNGVHAEIMKVKLISGFQNSHKMRQLRKVENKRRKLRKDVGHRRSDLKEFTNHKVSYEIAKFAAKFPNSIVIFEKGLAKLKNPTWSPADVRTKSEYKLDAFGIETRDIFPAYTSQICSHCGAIGTRTEGTVYFKCPSCGLGVGSNPASTIGQYNADVNASINIALRGLRVLTLFGKTVGHVDGTVAEPNAHPDDTAQDVNTPDIREAVEGMAKFASPRKDVEPVQVTSVTGETKSEAKANESRSTPHGKRATYGKIPPRARGSENGFSSWYKGNYNSTGRTELSSETESGEVKSQTEF